MFVSYVSDKAESLCATFCVETKTRTVTWWLFGSRGIQLLRSESMVVGQEEGLGWLLWQYDW